MVVATPLARDRSPPRDRTSTAPLVKEHIMDMQMNNRIPEWLTPLSWIILATAVASALVIAFDI